MKNKLGFTLLELLVVVIIIAILAAIALPQYQLARDKAEFAKYQSMVSSLRDAYDEYVLLHGVGTKNFEDLSFTMPGDFKQVYTHGAFTCVQNSDMFCCMSPSGDQSGGLIDCGKKDLSVICYQYFFNYNNVPGLRKQYCLAEENHKRANNLCSSLGTKLNVANTWTPSGNNNRYRFYKLN